MKVQDNVKESNEKEYVVSMPGGHLVVAVESGVDRAFVAIREKVLG